MNADSSPSPFPPQFYLGFAGKRALGDAAAVRRALAERLDAFAAALATALPGIEIVALGSAAEGADQLFLELARERGWPWRLVLPFAPAIFEQDFAPDSDPLARFRALCDGAVAIDLIPPPPSRRDGFTLCTDAIARQSDALLVVWDRQPGKQGGTNETLLLARELDRPSTVLSSADGSPIRDDLADPRCVAALAATVRRRHARGIVARLAEIGRGLALPPVPQTAPPDPAAPTAGAVLFARLRRLAYALGPQHRHSNAWVLVLHALASLFGVLGLVFDARLSHGAHLGLGALEFLLVGTGVGLTVWIKRTHLHARWVETRYLAEIVRSLVATERCPARADFIPAVAWEVYATLRLPLTTFFGRHRPPAQKQPLAFAGNYLAGRIRHQLDHHKAKRREAQCQHALVQWSFAVCTIVILLGTGAAFALTALHQDLPAAWFAQLFLRFAPVYLPLVSAALLVVPNLNDLNRRRTTYREVVEKLAALARETEALIADLQRPEPPVADGAAVWSDPALADAFARNRLRALVQETERVLLTEVVEFQSFCKHAEVG